MDNETRVLRFASVWDFAKRFIDEPSPKPDHLDLAYLLADMLHWCDAYGVDFQSAVALAQQHYFGEQNDDTLTPLS